MPVKQETVRLCSKLCGNCGKYRHLNDFFDLVGNTEYQDCYSCRLSIGNFAREHNGPLSNVLEQMDLGIKKPLTLPFKNGDTSAVPAALKTPIYFDVKVEDKTPILRNNDICNLYFGEKYTTWSDLIRQKNVMRKEERKRTMQQRVFKAIPWHYASMPRSHYELKMRRVYEKCWRSACDEAIPPILLKTRSWSTYWAEHKKTSRCKEKLAKEGGERLPFIKGILTYS